MAAIELRLDPTRIVSAHSSHIVNLDPMTEIEPIASGNARILLRDGTRLPGSRSYRDALRSVTMSRQ